MEASLSWLVPAEEVQRVSSLPGTRNRWPPLPLVILVVFANGGGIQFMHFIAWDPPPLLAKLRAAKGEVRLTIHDLVRVDGRH
jgi:hypothetical protein